MKGRRKVSCITLALGLLLAGAEAATAEPSFEVSGRYTAQRRPRVTVYRFDDTNQSAVNAKFGASVQAMLVTFFKRKSQFVVLERQTQGLDAVLGEWERNRKGVTNLRLSDPGALQLLEKLDAIIIGNVTLLDIRSEANVTQPKGDDQHSTGRRVVSGPRIEIDAKLLSRSDGRIIAAAQRSGPVACLRSIVERLGIALEQEYLRPYYGKLKFNLSQPENVQIFLTPILLDNALDEEKPPVERGVTVRIGGGQDEVESWTTDPSSYQVENLLSGWYSLRLERPGYSGEKEQVENFHWVARDVFGEVKIQERKTGLPLAQVDRKLSRFVVHVNPLATEVIQADGLGFRFEKLSGSAQPLVKRQYVDADFVSMPQRVFLVGHEDLELNRFDPPHEYAEDETCDLFDEQPPRVDDPGRTYVASGQRFDLDSFTGGRLIFEDYQGEPLPAGQYHMTIWEPNYNLLNTELRIRDKDVLKPMQSQMDRHTSAIELTATGRKPSYAVKLVGSATHYMTGHPLDFAGSKRLDALPADSYVASTTVPGLGGWSRTVNTLAKNQSPPVYDPKKDDEALERAAREKREAAEAEERAANGRGSIDTDETTTRPQPKAEYEPPILERHAGDLGGVNASLLVKTRATIGGRLEILGSLDPVREDLYVDPWVRPLLDELLESHGGPLEPLPGEGRRKFLRALGSSLATSVLTSATQVLASQNRLPLPIGNMIGWRPPVPDALPQGAAVAPKEEEVEELPDLPPDPEVLLALLTQHLEDLDLLVLNDEDMRRLQRTPQTALAIARFVEQGGALFAFVSGEGDFGDIAGASLPLKRKGKRTARFQLAGGDVDGFELEPVKKKKKIRVKSKRELPQLDLPAIDGSWRVLAFTHGHKEPRILERGKRDAGGYVLLWADSPDAFHGPRGGTVPAVESARTAVRRHVLAWARQQVKRRYGGAPEPPPKEGCAPPATAAVR